MQSGTGVYYQAMPAVGPDGKNVMKLIPVRQVNGHFVQTQAPLSRNVCLPAHTSSVPLPQNRIPTLQPTADGRFILKTPLEVNTVFNSVKSPHSPASNAILQPTANQVHVPLVGQTMPSPVQLNSKAVIVPHGSPNTVKTPALPSGHYLQIPSNATVRTLPASALPLSIKNQICHSSNEPNPVKGLPMVLYVSPVSSLKLDQQPPAAFKNPGEIPKASSPASTPNVVKSSGESSRNDHGGTAPMKWVVEERAGSRAQYLIPVTSPSMSSDILNAVKQMESSRPADHVKESVTIDIRKEVVTPGNDNALVMCNGKVYFVAKRNSDVTKDIITNPENVAKKCAQSPTAALGTVTPKQDPKRPDDNKKPSDVIDLCDDEDESSACVSFASIIQPSDIVNEHDEDSNVIFVSYIPPKSSETETGKEVAETTSPTSCVQDADKTSEAEITEADVEAKIACSTETDTNKCEAMDVEKPALEENEAPSDQLEVACGPQTDATEKSFEEMVPEQIPQPKSDRELRRTFGITHELSVSLQKLGVSTATQEDEEKRLMNKRTIDGIRKLIHNSKIETKIKQLIQSQEPKSAKSSKRKLTERNGGTKGSDSASLSERSKSNRSIESDDAIQSGSPEQRTDTRIPETCQSTEKETSSTSGTRKVSDITTNVPCSSSLSESVHTHAAKCESNSPACCSGLRKTLPRPNKGSGRVCTACPCGTKVGRVAANSSASKPHDTPSPCSKRDTNRDATTRDRVAASDSSSTSSDLGKAANPGRRSKVNRDVISTSANQQPAIIEISSRSSRCTKDKTHDRSTASQGETFAQVPTKLNERKAVPSSDRQLCYTAYKVPSELYSPVVLDPEEIKRQERIKRLKDLLQEKEAALEKLRKSM